MMRAEELTRDQARALKNKLRPMLNYLGRLKERMRRRGFVADDRLLAAVCRAEDAMHALSVEVHYLSCGDSVGRRATPADGNANRERANRDEQRRRLRHRG